MQRRRVLTGLAAAGVTFLAGCSSNNDSSNNDSGGNNTSQTTTDSGNGGNSKSSPTSTDTVTAAATTMATTTQQTATQMATTTSPSTAVNEPTSTTLPTTALMTTGASSSTSQPTGMETTGARTTGGGTTGEKTTSSGMATGFGNVNLSNLVTYTNDAHSFSIKRPAAWSDFTKTSSGYTSRSPTPISQLTVATISTPPSATLDQAKSSFLEGYQQGLGGSDAQVKILSKRKVKLASGNSAILFDIEIDTGPATIRQKALITLANGTAYLATIFVMGSAYSSSVGQQMEKILLSLTIHNGSTSA